MCIYILHWSYYTGVVGCKRCIGHARNKKGKKRSYPSKQETVYTYVNTYVIVVTWLTQAVGQTIEYYINA